MTSQSGGGGSSYPGVTPDGADGLTVVGGVFADHLVAEDGASSTETHPGYIGIVRANDNTAPFQIQLALGSSGAELVMYDGSHQIVWEMDADGTEALGGSFAVFGATPPAAKPAVTGSRGGNAALASLLTALASYGFITDSTTV